MRARRVSSRQLVEQSLERISRLDGQLNAVVALRAELALGEPRALDERVAAGEDPGPLAGLPVLVKDLEDVTGLRTTQGSALFACGACWPSRPRSAPCAATPRREATVAEQVSRPELVSRPEAERTGL